VSAQEPLSRPDRFLGGALLALSDERSRDPRLGPRQGGGSRLATVMCLRYP
jgi:hypothetical protein